MDSTQTFNERDGGGSREITIQQVDIRRYDHR